MTTTSYEYAIYEKKGHIAYITLNRPERLNALHIHANRELSGIWDDADNDPEVWVIILTGAGERAFSAGNDLKYTAEHGTSVSSGPPVKGGFGGLTFRYDLWKPVIAAVNGYAMGGGFELALACDIIVAAEHARFALPEPRVGLYAGAGGIHRLPRQIPLKIAMGMMLTGKQIDARRAEHLGLVNEVVPLADLMPAAERWAAEIMECAPLSVRGSKQGAMTGLDMPLEQAINTPYELLRRHNASPDRIEGPVAFSEKRPPVWRGI